MILFSIGRRGFIEWIDGWGDKGMGWDGMGGREIWDFLDQTTMFGRDSLMNLCVFVVSVVALRVDVVESVLMSVPCTS